MKRKFKSPVLLLAVVLCLSLITGCGSQNAETQQPSESTSSGPITVTDMMGQTITLDAPATKVVALTAADCEIVYALGAGDTVVGCGATCNYPPEVQNVTVVQSGAETNIEEIIALEPQVVFMATMAQTEEQVKGLQDAGIQVVVSNAEDIDGVYQSIEIIGKVLGKDAEAEDLIQGMKDTFADLKSKVPEGSGGKIYFEVSPLQYGLWTAGSGTFMDEMATMLGLENAFSDVSGWAQISEEQVLERNPDYIVTIAMADSGESPVDEILSRSGWEDMTAIKEQHVMAAGDEMSRPGPRLADAATELFEFVYGSGTEQNAA
jgi:iron complex transport system substrate-binding protein